MRTRRAGSICCRKQIYKNENITKFMISKSARRVSVSLLDSRLGPEADLWKNTEDPPPVRWRRLRPREIAQRVYLDLFSSRVQRGSGHQLNSTLNLIVTKEFAPVCRRFTHNPTRRQPRRQAQTARHTQRCTPSIQQAARHALFDRRTLRRDNLPTNHSLRIQHEYPQVNLSPIIGYLL